MTSQNSQLRVSLACGALLAFILAAAALSLGSPFFFVWIVLAAVLAWSFGRQLRPCARCGRSSLARRFFFVIVPGVSRERVCEPCLGAGELPEGPE